MRKAPTVRSARFRVVRWFFGRPILPFALNLVLLTPLILAENPGLVASAYAFGLPWLLLLLGVINLPFLAGAFRAFRLDAATRRNHVLEHATILHLEETCGRRFSGRAAPNGFRVSGPASVKQIEAAFDRVCRSVGDGEQLSYISPRCGSNIVTALGVSIGMLLLLALWSVIVHPPLSARVGVLATVVVAFAGLRQWIGNAIQRRYFMSTDFDEVSLRHIRSVPQGPLDRGPVHFVATIVRDRAHRRE